MAQAFLAQLEATLARCFADLTTAEMRELGELLARVEAAGEPG